MRKTLLQLLTFVLCITGMQNPLLAQEQTPLNQVVNTLKERISLSGYAQLGYTYDDARNSLKKHAVLLNLIQTKRVYS